jgi:hypothetical protein
MDQAENLEDLIDLPGVTDPAIRRLLGLFDVPAFARRGQELALAREAFRLRCARHERALLAMVHLRLRQWAAAATGCDDWRDVWGEPIAWLWDRTSATPPAWASASASLKRRRSLARELIASIERFNRRWLSYVASLDLDPLNRMIRNYNEYYLIEKECSLGSPRLAARAFEPQPLVSLEQVLAEFPLLPVPPTRDAHL